VTAAPPTVFLVRTVTLAVALGGVTGGRGRAVVRLMMALPFAIPFMMPFMARSPILGPSARAPDFD